MDAAKAIEIMNIIGMAGFFGLFVVTAVLAGKWLSDGPHPKLDPQDPYYKVMSGEVNADLDKILAQLRGR